MAVSAHVQKFELNKDGFTEFFIVILYQGREWGVRKRYSEFVKFDAYLQSSGFRVAYTLPEKSWWNRFDPGLLSKRLQELQNYLDVLLKATMSTDNSLIREFLEVDENTLKQDLAKKQSFREISYADRVQAVVKTTRRTMIAMSATRGTNMHAASQRVRQTSSQFFYSSSNSSSYNGSSSGGISSSSSIGGGGGISNGSTVGGLGDFAKLGSRSRSSSREGQNFAMQYTHQQHQRSPGGSFSGSPFSKSSFSGSTALV